MFAISLAIHKGLAAGTRLRRLNAAGQRNEALEWCFLAACGCLAAIGSEYLNLRLRIPGHAIMRAIFPMVLGLALVPRRGAGTVMSASALLTGIGLRAMLPSAGLGFGALTSLTLTGPLLDLSLRRASEGWRLYGGFALAGLAANMVAFAIRGGTKIAGWETLTARPLAEWVVQASISYAICGILAGLLSGVIWFHAAQSRDKPEDQSP